MDDQRKDHIDPIGPKQRNRPKQIQTHNLPTNDVEKINSTNKGRDLLLANKPQTERMLQRDFEIQTDHLISTRRPYLIILNQKERTC